MLKVDFINVGYGDAVLIRDTSADFAMLVDCGDIDVGRRDPDSPRITAAAFLQKENISRLDLLVLTHLHLDHSGGLTELLKHVTVKAFWTNYLPEKKYWNCPVGVPAAYTAGAKCLLQSLQIYLAALEQMDTAGTAIIKVRDSAETHALTPELKLTVHLEDDALYQRQQQIFLMALEGRDCQSELNELDGFINNTSIRLGLQYKDTRIELPGDIYAAQWEKHDLKPCTVVKLPHHGHGDSITAKLLDMLQPQEVVISVSNNRPDRCPDPKVIQEIQQRGYRLYITDAVSIEDQPALVQSAVHFEWQ